MYFCTHSSDNRHSDWVHNWDLILDLNLNITLINFFPVFIEFISDWAKEWDRSQEPNAYTNRYDKPKPNAKPMLSETKFEAKWVRIAFDFALSMTKTRTQ